MVQIMMQIMIIDSRWRWLRTEFLDFFHDQMVSLLNGLCMNPPIQRPSTAMPIMTVTYLVSFSVYSWVASEPRQGQGGTQWV